MEDIKKNQAGELQRRSHVEKMISKFREHIPVRCEKCGSKLVYTGAGMYECADCKSVTYDDFGKVRAYLDEKGPTPAAIIAKETGVDIEEINVFLKKGRLEIPEGSSFYIKCERCGCNIRYGRYCPECTKQLAGKIQSVLMEDMGEKPKNANGDMKGKMHFLKR